MKVVLTFFLLLTTLVSYTQISFTNGEHNLQISGSLSSYYNHRFLKSGEFDQKKNRFRLRDAQVQIEGKYKNSIEYEFQVDFADLASANSGTIDPENPGLMDAYIVFKQIPFLDVKVGYGKTPYSRSSFVPFMFSPYWQRAELVRGDVFSRRDIGLTLSSFFWKQRINVYAGAYTGLGEIGLKGDNDASGNPEVIGRIDLAYPSRYRYRDIDTKITPIPMFALGFNGRYTDKTQPQVTFLPIYSSGEYLIKLIDGKKSGIGADFTFQYMGFSAQFEIHQMIIKPSRMNSFLFQGTSPEFNEGYVRAGGYYTQFNYFSKSLRTIFSIRYETLNINDLANGELQRFCAALAYQFKNINAMVKAQYFLNLNEETQINPLKWNEQIRIGIQYIF
jgi:hypothetical protein